MLNQAGGPQSTAELHMRLDSKVPISSLYRSLAVLETGGVLRKHHDADGLTRFELAEWLVGHHHHLICLQCGTVEDVELDHATEVVLTELVERIGSKAGYDPRGHVLEVEGVCGSCSS